jgi:hypothetical protein
MIFRWPTPGLLQKRVYFGLGGVFVWRRPFTAAVTTQERVYSFLIG